MSDMTNEAKVGDGPLCDQMQALQERARKLHPIDLHDPQLDTADPYTRLFLLAEYWKAEHLAGNARIGELHDELAATALRSADHLRRAIKAEAKCEVLEMNLEAARRELAKVNNEFGSENADWPETWRRVAEVKERAGRLWRDNETLRAALTVVVRDWTEQFERNGHLAPAWVRQAREALGPNAELSGAARRAGSA